MTGTDRLRGDPIPVHCPGSGRQASFGDRCPFCVDQVAVTPDGFAVDHEYDDVTARWRRGDFGREGWLNGHVRSWGEGTGGTIDTLGLRCVGCGLSLGTAAIVITEQSIDEALAEPDWPFEVDGCPVCAGREARQALAECRDEVERLSTSAARTARRGPLP